MDDEYLCAHSLCDRATPNYNRTILGVDIYHTCHSVSSRSCFCHRRYEMREPSRSGFCGSCCRFVSVVCVVWIGSSAADNSSAWSKMSGLWCDINFEVRQIMYQIVNGLQRRRHFCFDANPYGIARRGLRRNRNVWAAVSSELSHFELESTWPNTAPEPTASPPLAEAFARFGACRFSRRGSALDR